MKFHGKMFTPLGRRVVEIAESVSVRSKILGLSLGLVLLFGISSTFVVQYSLREVMTEELKARATSIAHDLASRSADSMLMDDLYQLNTLITNTMESSEDIRYVFITDPAGGIPAHSFGTGFPAGLLEANSNPAFGYTHIEPLLTSEGRIWDVATPILNGQVGVVRIGFTEAVVQRAVRDVTYKMLFATVLVSTLGIVISLVLTRILTRPILDLVHTSEAIGRGDFHQRINSWANDEIGRLAVAFNAMAEKLAKAEEVRRERECLRTEMIERIIQAQEDERGRIARDLHDQTSQYLTSLIVQLKLVETASNDEVRRENILELRDQIRTTLADVRRMAVDLRPGILDDLGLVAAIQWFADRCECMRQTFDGSGQILRIEVVSSGYYNDLSPQHVVTIYRVAQEALTNVAKHSHARDAVVVLSRDNDCVGVEIRDEGVGFLPAEGSKKRTGMGLFGMRERVELLGGEFTISSSMGVGTCVHVLIPIHKHDPHKKTSLQTESAGT